MFRAIMIPLDGSAFGEYALPAALPLARASGACIHLVHVRTELSWLALTDDSRDPERIYLENVAIRLRATGVRVQFELLEDELGDVMPAGRPNRIIADVLRDYARRHGIDLIVATSHGRGGIRRGWLGSVVDTLVRLSFVPVLVVRPPQRHAAPEARAERAVRNILVPLDGSRIAERALHVASDIAALTRASLHVVRVVEPLQMPANPYADWVLPPRTAVLRSQRTAARQYLDHVFASMKAAGHVVQTSVMTGTPVSAILRAATAANADLIVMGTHGSGGATRLLVGSVADKVLRTSTTPVLVVRMPEPGEESERDDLGIEEDDVLAELGAPSWRLPDS